MRNLSTPPRLSTATNKNEALKTRNVVKGYPELLRFDINHINDDSFEILPASIGSLNKFSRFTFEVGTEAFQHSITDDWTMDLTETTIDLVTFTGGIVDGIARSAGREYLYWAFLDANLDFAGIGITQKPLSAITAMSATPAVKGTTVDFTINIISLGTAYKFTVGSRVRIRNSIGTFTHTKEYNWGTILSIKSSSILEIELDNDSEYGRNLTGLTGMIVEQQDKYRPFVPTSSTQPLYQPYYALLGEIEQGSANAIINVYKSTDEFRDYSATVFNDLLNAYSTQKLELGYWLPLWTNSANFRLNMRASLGNRIINIVSPASGSANLWSNSDTTRMENNSGLLKLFRKARIDFQASTTDPTERGITIIGYQIEGGMRQ